ncbi:MAG: hypothetical protein MUE85_03515 [Microscillaceae bacterium]|jgi:hypothetical protein|nr:hypothetical protein [Microscillaceae bacterium]
MYKLLIISTLSIVFLACQDQKALMVEKVNTVACQDAKDMITAHANDLVPIVGKLLLNLAVKEELQKNTICECLSPSIKKYLQETYQAAELENMLIDKARRSEAIKKALGNQSGDIFRCYEQKGLKGVKLIKDFVNKLIK